MKLQVSRIHFRHRSPLSSPNSASPDASTPLRLVSKSITSHGTDVLPTGSIVVWPHPNHLVKALESLGDDDAFSSRRRRELEAWGDLHPSKLPSWKRARKEEAAWRVPAPTHARAKGKVRLDH